MVEERKDQPILLAEEDTEKSDTEKRSEASFLEMIRGGLCKPSDMCSDICSCVAPLSTNYEPEEVIIYVIRSPT